MEFSWNLGILSRIWSGFESRQNHAVARNPGVSMSGQVLFHPSHICQFGESDQGLIVWPSNRQPLPHGSSGFSSIRLSEASIKSTTDVLNPNVHHRRRTTGKAFDMPSLPLALSSFYWDCIHCKSLNISYLRIKLTRMRL
jgi:hypothetical protein